MTYCITGGSRGIGRAICIALAENAGKEDKIIFTYRDKRDEAQTLCERLEKTGVKVEPLQVDFNDTVLLNDFINWIVVHNEKIDILVNNAGILDTNYFIASTEKEWHKIIQINLLAQMSITHDVAKKMVKNHSGRIINISSAMAYRQLQGSRQAAYVASKSGVIGFTRAIASEIARFGVYVFGIAPGFIDTDMLSAIPKSYYNRLESYIPVGRLGTSEEIAQLALFQMSGKCDYLNGQTVIIDGGFSI